MDICFMQQQGFKRRKLHSSQSTGTCDLQKMNTQLAAVAAADFRDVERLLLNEILHCMDILLLLSLRRVNRTWKTAISQECARLPHVLIAVDKYWYSYTKTWSRLPYWNFVNKAVSLVICGIGSDINGKSDQNRVAVRNVWRDYEECVAVGRAVSINKVIYANVVFGHEVLDHHLLRQPGFRTTLYNTTIELDVSVLCRKDLPEFYFQLFTNTSTAVKVTGNDSFVMPANACDLANDERFFGPVAQHFVMRHAARLTTTQVNRIIGSVTRNPWTELSLSKLWSYVMRLQKRLDADNVVAWEKYSRGDLRGVLREVHPIVSVLLYKVVELQTERNKMDPAPSREDFEDSGFYYDENEELHVKELWDHEECCTDEPASTHGEEPDITFGT